MDVEIKKMTMKNLKISIGPCLFNWKVNYWRDFYFKIAESPYVEEVYLGEVVCYKRYPFFEVAIQDVIEKLVKNGKKVYLSTFSLILSDLEMNTCKKLIDLYGEDIAIEVNDIGMLGLLNNKKHIIGPTINVYNEGTLKFLENNGAQRFCFPYELDRDSLKILSSSTQKEKEIFVFGRMPLAIAARCYHARMHNYPKDDCKYVCEKDYNGKAIQTLQEENFLTVNGTQTMSYSYNNLIAEIDELKQMGFTIFRLSPHFLDMDKVIEVFYNRIHGIKSTQECLAQMKDLLPDNAKYSNGFYYNSVGRDYIKGNTDQYE